MGDRFIPNSKNTVNIPVGSEDDRIRKFKYRNDMLNDNFYNQVEVELGNVYSKSVEMGLISQIDDTNNLFRMVIDEVSKAYSNGVWRTFSDNETLQEDMTALYDSLHIDDMMTQANRYINAFNDVLIQVGVKNDNINLRLRRPDNTVVKYNDDMELEEVYVYVSSKDNIQTWYGYTETEAFKVEVTRASDVLEADRLPHEGEEDTVNALGFLPFVPVHNGFRDDSFWQMYKGDDLVKGTIQVAIKLTFLNHLIKMQSFKQLVATGSNLQQLNGAVLDPQTLLYVEGNDTDIKTLDLESNYKSLWETIQSINNNIAINYKISPNQFRLTGDVSSGFALQMENVKLDKFIKGQQAVFGKAEKDLFNMIKRVDDAFGLGVVKGETFGITYSEPSYPKSDQERLETQEKEINLGLTNQVEIIMEEQGVDEETATEIYQRNIRIRNMATEKFNAPTLNEKTTAEKLNLE